MTIVQGHFEWDSEKDEINIKKHGFSFEEILSMFDDPQFIERVDLEHSTVEEERFIGFGNINGLVIVATIFTERDRIRIISSRLATKKEEAFYYEQRKNFDS
ncbi:BrnT family toxin [Treponema parvum]|uniref:BrnT family toxin n=1 Tax=Treponema parvum TaxID=138851 RepID=A0A975F456_9SPIR|nr:BrnT family toxin [Treponema parvum]QTQ13908.1 BrnT family toxin [Treponema parvum]